MNNTSASAGKPATLCRLKQAVADLEGQRADLGLEHPALPFGIAEIDRTLGGGLAPSNLHEIAANSWIDVGATFGFTLALAARAHDRRDVLWIQTDFAALESGNLYGRGSDAFGLPARTMLILKTPRPIDALRAMEEALRCRALSSVICELPDDGPAADLTATQRLTLAARESSAFGFLLRHRPSPLSVVADTRWTISAAASRPDRFGGLGYAAFTATLRRNRRGPEGQWTIAWNHHEKVFSTLSLDMAQAAFDRPDRAQLACTG
jgi:protein ImuA